MSPKNRTRDAILGALFMVLFFTGGIYLLGLLSHCAWWLFTQGWDW